MTDPSTPTAKPDNFGDLPLQPTGSGVADIEIAYEQMRLAADAGETDGVDPATVPTEQGEDAADSEAHPS
jgi:hypothetical protein